MTSETRMRTLLERAGFTCEPEPDWIKEGKKPDFFCSGPLELWCEVKTLAPTTEFTALSDVLEALAIRTKNIGKPGRGMAFVGTEVTSRDLKKVTSLLTRWLGRLTDPDAPNNVVALVPKDPDFSQFARFAISTEDDRRVEVYSYRSTSDTYSLPYAVRPDPDDQTVEMQLSSGAVKSAPAYELIDGEATLRIAVVSWPDKKAFSLISASPSGPARAMTTSERIREAVGEANSQLKNAVAYRDAPSLLAIVHDGADVADDIIVISALYGDLKYQFTPGNPDSGRLFVGDNGAWNRTKNRSTSAVMYVRNRAKPLIVRNLWASRALPNLSLTAKEVNPRQDGSFEETDG
jgi:hypothetical protein